METGSYVRGDLAILEAGFAALEQAVLVYDVQGKIVACNPAAAKLAGRPVDDILGRGAGEYEIDRVNWRRPELYGKLITPDVTRTVPTLRSSFARYYENVRDAMLGTAELAVTPEWSLDVMRGLQLAVESNRTRRVLPWNP